MLVSLRAPPNIEGICYLDALHKLHACGRPTAYVWRGDSGTRRKHQPGHRPLRYHVEIGAADGAIKVCDSSFGAGLVSSGQAGENDGCSGSGSTVRVGQHGNAELCATLQEDSCPP